MSDTPAESSLRWQYALDVPGTASPEVFAHFKHGWECWNDGELDLMGDMYAEDAELDMSAVFTGMPKFSGRESMRRQWHELWETWEGLRMEPLEVTDVGDGRSVVDTRLSGRGKRSGIDVDQRYAFIYTVREADMKVVRCQLFPSVDAAIDSATTQRRMSGEGVLAEDASFKWDPDYPLEGRPRGAHPRT